MRSLDREAFKPTLILFPSTTPTLDPDVAEIARLKAHFGAPIFCFGPHASTTPRASMLRAPDVDGMFVGEPEDAALALARLDSLDGLATIPSLTWRRGPSSSLGAGDTIVPHSAQGSYSGFATMPFPAWDLVPMRLYSLPLVNRPYVIVETSRGCPYSCDFCVAPIHQGHKFRERSAKALVDEIERSYRDFGVDFFYLWGDTVTLNVKTFTAFCDELIARNLPIQWFGNARADNLTDPAFVHRLRKAGCWMLAMGIETESEEIRKDMVKKLERQKIQAALTNMRDAGIRSFAFFILGYPGETLATIDHTIEYAIELNPDFANFYPAVPYPGTALYDKVVRDGMLVDEDWSRMEYSVLPAQGQRPGRARGDGRDQPRQAALLHAAGVSLAPARRRHEARGHQAGHLPPDCDAHHLRRPRPRPAPRAALRRLAGGLRPPDSPTRSLARRFAGALRSRGSLAALARDSNGGRCS